MKINNLAGVDTVVNTNNREQVQDRENVQQEANGKVKNGAVKGSELNLIQDPIEEKKKKAMEEAMEFIKNQFKTDQNIDDVLDECHDSIKTSKAAAEEASKELVDIEKRKEELGEMYADKEDEEYKTRLSELDKEASHWRSQYEGAHKVIAAATKGIKGIKQEALKHHGMVDAGKLAEASLKATSDEIIGMLKNEAIEKVDEDMEEVIEEAKEAKEEKVKEDAELEEIRIEREKQAQEIEEELEKAKQQAKNSVYVPDKIDVRELMNRQQEIVKNTERILEEQKLLEEDIKGMMMDSLL
ncbi:MAG: hypothetical protein HFH36_09010 [Lachnospiraceae bacterium]|nr:hypothetical protein [Lachnospiraceae bacterium]